MLSMLFRSGLAVLALLSVALAGCAGGGGQDPIVEEVPELEVTSTTGGIRGVVVDDAIRPVKGATVEVESIARSATTDETGLFTFTGLEAGTYFVKASHPLYDVQQQSVEVVAGIADPQPVKFLLNRIVPQDPYLVTLKYDGFIVCSANLIGAYSEECGEGVGVPCEVPPPVGCQRHGGQGNNEVQFDFVPELGAKSIVVEQVWEATSAAGSAFFTPVSTEWSCLPVCSGNGLISMDGPSPLHGYIDEETMLDNEVVPGETVVSVFTWSSIDTNPVGVILNQPFQTFVTVSYYLPLPEDWSFVAGSPNPFTTA